MRPWVVWAMFILLAIYNWLDWYHTKMAFEFGIAEANPFLNEMTIDQIAATKILFLTLLAMLLTSKSLWVKTTK